jgi:hypothetical protein
MAAMDQPWRREVFEFCGFLFDASRLKMRATRL